MTHAPVSSAAVVDGIDVDAVAAAVTACPAVSGLFGGVGNVVATYLPGRRVAGVEVSPTTAVITVRCRWNATAAELLRQISTALSPLLQGRRLEVVVGDIDDAPDSADAAGSAAAPPAVLEAKAATVAEAKPAPATRPVPPQTATATLIRAPGSAPAPSAVAPKPAPPAFPTV